MTRDVIHHAGHHADEPPPSGSHPLLKPVMEDGTRTRTLPSLDEVRAFHADRMRELPDELRGVRPSDSYRVDVSEMLLSLSQDEERKLKLSTMQDDSTCPTNCRLV